MLVSGPYNRMDILGGTGTLIVFNALQPFNAFDRYEVNIFPQEPVIAPIT